MNCPLQWLSRWNLPVQMAPYRALCASGSEAQLEPMAFKLHGADGPNKPASFTTFAGFLLCGMIALAVPPG